MIKSSCAKIVSLLAVSASLLVFSCTNGISDKSDELLATMLASGANAASYGSIVVGPDSSRALNISDISFAEVVVSGTGIKSGNEPSSGKIVVKDGQASGIKVDKIPVGKNRIITVQAYDRSKEKLGTVTLRGICNINPGNNSATISWGTTALGNVFNSMHELGHDVSSVSEEKIQQIQSVLSLLEPVGGKPLYPAMINTKQLAMDFIDGADITNPTQYKSYILNAASLSFKTTIEGEYSVQVGDPVSEGKTFSAGEGSVSEIAPGTWRVSFVKDGKVLKNTFATFESGKNTDLGNVTILADKIVLHVENYKTIWSWTKSTGKNFTGGTWPGVAMNPDSQENWYTYELPVEAEMVIFSNNGGGQTADLVLPGAGEWWYTGAKWYDEDPADYIDPIVEEFSANKTGTVSGTVALTIAASDDKALEKAILYSNGKVFANITLDGKLCRKVYDWDTTVLKNGEFEIYAEILDKAGNKVETQKTQFTTENENREPVAVINGSVNVGLGKTKKFNGKSSYDPNGTIASYSWKVSGGARILEGANSAEVSIEFPNSKTTCEVELTVTDDNGAENTVKKIVAVQELISSDFREESIYFAMTTRFFDGDKSNNVHCWDENATTPMDDPAWRGDFKGLIEKLDYIKALGFSAVWITPVVENCSGLDYHGYHAMNLTKVDPRYESADTDFQKLIDEVHARGMKLVLDVVFNHVGNFGETNLCKMFEKDYSANLEDINDCLKIPADSELLKQFPGYATMKPADQYGSRLALMKNTDYVNHDYNNYFHHFGFGNWDNFSVQFFQMAGDCVELNTENPKVLKYIGDAYSKYIEMGVDAFRIDTGKHISRLEFNFYLNNRFKETAAACGNDNFYMFTEICAKSSDVTYRGNVENLSPYFYTWMDEDDYGFTMEDENQFDDVIIYPESAETEKDEVRVLRDLDYWTRPTKDGGTKTPVNALAVQKQGMATTDVRPNRPESKNHLLDGNNYHEPDYSMRSGLDVIDFPMHWNFGTAQGAYSVRGGDKYYNDATWNVVYVDSHDYGPGDQFEQRYQRSDDYWAENMDLMFTFRGIPCIYYGSEIGFMRGAIIDKGPIMPLCETGRAYFGDHIEGSVKVDDFGEWSNATGSMKETLEYPLAKHLQRLNVIRRSIPALQKGQYSTENISGAEMAFKRRFTKDGEDSFVLVAISNDATFSNLPAGTYVDAITGDTKTIAAGGSLSTSGCSGQGNMRIYVLNGTGKIGDDTEWLK